MRSCVHRFPEVLRTRDVVTKTIDVGQSQGREKSVDLGEIAEGRGGERVPRIDGPCDLAGVERNRHVVFYVLVERLGQVKILALLWIESSKEPELVFHNRSTDVAADVNF